MAYLATSLNIKGSNFLLFLDFYNKLIIKNFIYI